MRVRFLGKITFKDLLFVTRNGDGSHIDNGILEVLQLEMHAVQPIGLLSVTRILFFPTELPGVFMYEIQVLFSSFKSGLVRTADELVNGCLQHYINTGWLYVLSRN